MNNSNTPEFISCKIDKSVTFGKNVKIYPGNIVQGNTHLGDNVVLMPNNYICDCTIGDNSIIEYSYLKQSKVGKNVKIGPFCHLRPNSIIDDDCKIGNFCEVKNSHVGGGTKASHLTYIGDSDIGKNCNIGCGVIFVNYNGKIKNKTIVEDNCFIGSNVNLIAPLHIKKGTYICAGSTLTVNTNDYDFVVARERETIKPKLAKKFLKEN